MGEKKRFLDRVLRFMGIEEEELIAEEIGKEEFGDSAFPNVGNATEFDDRRETSTDSAANASPRRSSGSLAQVVPMQPIRFNDVQAIADSLLGRRPVLVDLEELDGATARRVLDFLGGTVYALEGHVQRIREQTFLFTPGNVDVDVSRLIAAAGDGDDGFLFRS